MKSLIILSCLFSFALFEGIIIARKDPGEHWQGVKKDEPMPELIQGIVDASKITSMTSSNDHHCDTKSRDFEPRPNVSAYNDDSELKERKDYTKDFEARPDMSFYNDDMLKKASFTTDFEPRPSATSYTDADKLKEDEPLDKDFEPRPNVSAYSDDVVRGETN